ncbi:MAG: hypothetical protein WD512_13160, partial [Candidatus Paceibacterota bacterium]
SNFFIPFFCLYASPKEGLFTYEAPAFNTSFQMCLYSFLLSIQRFEHGAFLRGHDYLFLIKNGAGEVNDF